MSKEPYPTDMAEEAAARDLNAGVSYDEVLERMPLMKLYLGTRLPDGAIVTVDGKPLPLRLDLANHSPTGFEWGYGGSGPAQLSLALLADVLGNDEHAQRLYQKFKARWTQNLSGDNWVMTSEDIMKIVRVIRVTCVHVWDDEQTCLRCGDTKI